jgi:PBP1b-binding outer membrane lipoprotein LpoB
MKKLLYSFVALTFLVIVGCSEQKTNKPTEEVKEEKIMDLPEVESPQMVKRSELSEVMRNMFNELRVFSDNYEKGKTLAAEQVENFSKIITAKPTAPSDTSGAYKSMAQRMINSFGNLSNTETSTIANYNNMIGTCIACHSIQCPGPILVIKNLKLKD